MKYDFYCIDEDGDDICTDARTYADAIRKFFAGMSYTAKKARNGYNVWAEGAKYKVVRGEAV